MSVRRRPRSQRRGGAASSPPPPSPRRLRPASVVPSRPWCRRQVRSLRLPPRTAPARARAFRRHLRRCGSFDGGAGRRRRPTSASVPGPASGSPAESRRRGGRSIRTAAPSGTERPTAGALGRPRSGTAFGAPARGRTVAPVTRPRPHTEPPKLRAPSSARWASSTPAPTRRLRAPRRRGGRRGTPAISAVSPLSHASASPNLPPVGARPRAASPRSAIQQAAAAHPRWRPFASSIGTEVRPEINTAIVSARET
jgi:hypothetical protein